ncbi:uncharacterized protein LOC109600835 [Aethina tumida]|uniref:uncharacterized protein LOC109600835 n=1 Tax=Aethina tumida TaxID=116153 RepID=UPI0021477D9E|nr:uncharacterized protein LOC109600835 [Aethina tumida]XP_019872587.2 uncharacterized protein LOC109600835 [Aethina tumida]
MPSDKKSKTRYNCSYCKKQILSEDVECKVCKEHYHVYCAYRYGTLIFSGSKKLVVCCEKPENIDKLKNTRGCRPNTTSTKTNDNHMMSPCEHGKIYRQLMSKNTNSTICSVQPTKKTISNVIILQKYEIVSGESCSNTDPFSKCDSPSCNNNEDDLNTKDVEADEEPGYTCNIPTCENNIKDNEEGTTILDQQFCKICKKTITKDMVTCRLCRSIYHKTCVFEVNNLVILSQRSVICCSNSINDSLSKYLNGSFIKELERKGSKTSGDQPDKKLYVVCDSKVIDEEDNADPCVENCIDKCSEIPENDEGNQESFTGTRSVSFAGGPKVPLCQTKKISLEAVPEGVEQQEQPKQAGCHMKKESTKEQPDELRPSQKSEAEEKSEKPKSLEQEIEPIEGQQEFEVVEQKIEEKRKSESPTPSDEQTKQTEGETKKLACVTKREDPEPRGEEKQPFECEIKKFACVTKREDTEPLGEEIEPDGTELLEEEIEETDTQVKKTCGMKSEDAKPLEDDQLRGEDKDKDEVKKSGCGVKAEEKEPLEADQPRSSTASKKEAIKSEETGDAEVKKTGCGIKSEDVKPLKGDQPQVEDTEVKKPGCGVKVEEKKPLEADEPRSSTASKKEAIMSEETGDAKPVEDDQLKAGDTEVKSGCGAKKEEEKPPEAAQPEEVVKEKENDDISLEYSMVSEVSKDESIKSKTEEEEDICLGCEQPCIDECLCPRKDPKRKSTRPSCVSGIGIPSDKKQSIKSETEEEDDICIGCENPCIDECLCPRKDPKRKSTRPSCVSGIGIPSDKKQSIKSETEEEDDICIGCENPCIDECLCPRKDPKRKSTRPSCVSGIGIPSDKKQSIKSETEEEDDICIGCENPCIDECLCPRKDPKRKSTRPSCVSGIGIPSDKKQSIKSETEEEDDICIGCENPCIDECLCTRKDPTRMSTRPSCVSNIVIPSDKKESIKSEIDEEDDICIGCENPCIDECLCTRKDPSRMSTRPSCVSGIGIPSDKKQPIKSETEEEDDICLGCENPCIDECLCPRKDPTRMSTRPSCVSNIVIPSDKKESIKSEIEEEDDICIGCENPCIDECLCVREDPTRRSIRPSCMSGIDMPPDVKKHSVKDEGKKKVSDGSLSVEIKTDALDDDEYEECFGCDEPCLDECLCPTKDPTRRSTRPSCLSGITVPSDKKHSVKSKTEEEDDICIGCENPCYDECLCPRKDPTRMSTRPSCVSGIGIPSDKKQSIKSETEEEDDICIGCENPCIDECLCPRKDPKRKSTRPSCVSGIGIPSDKKQSIKSETEEEDDICIGCENPCIDECLCPRKDPTRMSTRPSCVSSIVIQSDKKQSIKSKTEEEDDICLGCDKPCIDECLCTREDPTRRSIRPSCLSGLNLPPDKQKQSITNEGDVGSSSLEIKSDLLDYEEEENECIGCEEPCIDECLCPKKDPKKLTARASCISGSIAVKKSVVEDTKPVKADKPQTRDVGTLTVLTGVIDCIGCKEPCINVCACPLVGKSAVNGAPSCLSNFAARQLYPEHETTVNYFIQEERPKVLLDDKGVNVDMPEEGNEYCNEVKCQCPEDVEVPSEIDFLRMKGGNTNDSEISSDQYSELSNESHPLDMNSKKCQVSKEISCHLNNTFMSCALKQLANKALVNKSVDNIKNELHNSDTLIQQKKKIGSNLYTSWREPQLKKMRENARNVILSIKETECHTLKPKHGTVNIKRCNNKSTGKKIGNHNKELQAARQEDIANRILNSVQIDCHLDSTNSEAVTPPEDDAEKRYIKQRETEDKIKGDIQLLEAQWTDEYEKSKKTVAGPAYEKKRKKHKSKKVEKKGEIGEIKIEHKELEKKNCEETQSDGKDQQEKEQITDNIEQNEKPKEVKKEQKIDYTTLNEEYNKEQKNELHKEAIKGNKKEEPKNKDEEGKKKGGFFLTLSKKINNIP